MRAIHDLTRQLKAALTKKQQPPIYVVVGYIRTAWGRRQVRLSSVLNEEQQQFMVFGSMSAFKRPVEIQVSGRQWLVHT